MSDFDAFGDSIDELEALVLASAGYVRASDDLRPRVLESARMELREQRAKHSMRHALLFVLLAGTCTSAHVDGDSVREFPQVAAAMKQLDAPAASVPSVDNGDIGWNVVDAFTELRRRQSEVLPIEL